DQKENETIVWIYALYSNTPGDYIQKNVVDCTGEEITEEWLYHLGVPETLINKLSKQDSINTNPVYMPFVTSYFMPRVKGDRPNVVPTGSKNLAFIGNFAESPTRDTVFTTEYSIRTAMESVYNLLNVDRGVPEVFNSIYDIRELLKSMYYLNDKQKLTDSDLPIPEFVKNKGLQKVKGTWIGKLLEDAKLI
ncbi:oleate hydratase, partial [Ligilactobacillus pobuzihii]